MSRRVHPLLLGLLSGALLSAAYRLPGAWPLSFIALVPLLTLIYSPVRNSQVFWAAALAGTMLMATATSWFLAALPLPAIFGAIPVYKAVLFVVSSWVLVALVTGPMVGFWALLARLLKPAHMFEASAIAILYVAFEYARLASFNVLTYSPEIQNPLFFSAGFIGYPLMDSATWRIFGYFGIGAVSFLVVLLNLLFFWAFDAYQQGRGSLRVLVSAGLVAIISVTPLVPLRQAFDANAQTVPLRVVAFSIPRPPTSTDDGVAFTAEILAQMPGALATNPDLVVLPEDARLFAPSSARTFAQIAGNSTAAFIDSGISSDKGERHENSYVVSAQATALVRDKLIFTPQGEYLPSLGRLIIQASGAQQSIDEFDNFRSLTQGGDGAGAEAGAVRASVLFCLEVLKPGFGARLASEQGSNVLVVPSSHDWFHSSRALETDVLRYERAQALAADMPLIVSTDQSPAYVLDRYGAVVATGLGTSSPAIVTATIHVQK